jgi:hypothetical protein
MSLDPLIIRIHFDMCIETFLSRSTVMVEGHLELDHFCLWLLLSLLSAQLTTVLCKVSTSNLCKT